MRGFWTVAPPTSRELRNYGLLMVVVSTLVTAVLWYKGYATAPWWSAGVGGGFLAATLIWRPAMRPFYHVWMLLAAVLGYVNTHILLAVIFYTMFTVTGLVMRAFGRDPLRLKAFGRRRTDSQGPAQSLWLRREQPLLPADHYKRQF